MSMVANAEKMAVLVADPSFADRVPAGPTVSVVTPRTLSRLDIRQRHLNLFVVSTATDLAPVAGVVHEASRLHKLRALFVRADVDCSWSLPLLDRAGIRTIRNTIVYSSHDLPARVLRAWSWGAEHHLIADAAATDGRLLVRDCALATLEIAFDQLPALARIPKSCRGEFSVDADGSFLHWADRDVHISLDEIRYALEPKFRASTDVKRLASQERFGQVIADLRREHGLRQSDVPGLSARQVSRIEGGAVSPRVQTLEKLASAHKMLLDEYLDSVAASIGPKGAA